jgi:hypothetical protein
MTKIRTLPSREKIEKQVSPALKSVGLCGVRSFHKEFTPGYSFTKDDTTFTVFDIDDYKYDFTNFDGVIIAGGCFEKIGSGRDQFGDEQPTFNYFPQQLMERERQIYTGLTKGKWFAFMLPQMSRNTPFGVNITETDLSKKLLAYSGVDWHEFKSPKLPTESKQNEFHSYFEENGVAFLNLELSNREFLKPLAICENFVVSAVFKNNIFFLPYHPYGSNSDKFARAVVSLNTSINSYRLKNFVSFPKWLSDISFRSEKLAQDKIDKIRGELVSLEAEIELFNGYKTILTTSGYHLVSQIKVILDDFFEIQYTEDEKFIEDIMITNNGELFSVTEIKGVNGGITRKHISQVENHRERCKLAPNVRGLLIVNDNMTLDGLPARRKVTPHPDALSIANILNIKIIRTIDLIDLMIKWEPLAKSERKRLLLNMINEQND